MQAEHKESDFFWFKSQSNPPANPCARLALTCKAVLGRCEFAEGISRQFHTKESLLFIQQKSVSCGILPQDAEKANSL